MFATGTRTAAAEIPPAVAAACEAFTRAVDDAQRGRHAGRGRRR